MSLERQTSTSKQCLVVFHYYKYLESQLLPDDKVLTHHFNQFNFLLPFPPALFFIYYQNGLKGSHAFKHYQTKKMVDRIDQHFY